MRLTDYDIVEPELVGPIIRRKLATKVGWGWGWLLAALVSLCAQL